MCSLWATDQDPARRSVRRTAIDILSYLHQHPLAKDTSSGVARWWVDQDEETVEKALRLLIEEGAVVKDREMYGLRPGGKAEEKLFGRRRDGRPRGGRRR